MRRSSITTATTVALSLCARIAAAQTGPTNPTPPTQGSADRGMDAAIQQAVAEGGATERDRAAAPAQAPTPTPPPANLLDRIGQMFSMHGYFRVRPELMSHFGLGWDNAALLAGGTVTFQDSGLPWVRNPDNGLLNVCSTDPASGSTMRVAGDCTGQTQTMANMRFRMNPEIHVTDNIVLHAQLDVFDNLVLGSTPQGYYVGSGYSPWAPAGAFSQTQVTPTSQNSLIPSITASRAWAEVTHPSLGQIRFGRMPSQWGLGLLANAGNGIDSDFQSHADRIMYAGRVQSLGLFFGAFYDFAGSGLTSGDPRYEVGQGQTIDISQLDDVHQYGGFVGRRLDPAETRRRLAHGDVVWNGGLYGVYRSQTLTYESLARDTNALAVAGPGTGNNSTIQAHAMYRGAQAGILDGWFQLLHRNFRFEVEAVGIVGRLNTQITNGDIGSKMTDIFQFGGALEFEYRLLNNRLQLDFRAGYASGDSDLEGLTYGDGLRPPVRNAATSNTFFRFHPDYRVDMILWRQIFRQVSGAYYFRPGVQYALIDRPGGDRLYGRAQVIWSRASQFVQDRGNAADLGVEINGEITYQSNFRNTSLGDPPGAGFFASVQYGVLFPMAGLGPRADERQTPAYSGFSFDTAQTFRGILGVMY